MVKPKTNAARKSVKTPSRKAASPLPPQQSEGQQAGNDLDSDNGSGDFVPPVTSSTQRFLDDPSSDVGQSDPESESEEEENELPPGNSNSTVTKRQIVTPDPAEDVPLSATEDEEGSEVEFAVSNPQPLLTPSRVSATESRTPDSRSGNASRERETPKTSGASYSSLSSPREQGAGASRRSPASPTSDKEAPNAGSSAAVVPESESRQLSKTNSSEPPSSTSSSSSAHHRGGKERDRRYAPCHVALLPGFSFRVLRVVSTMAVLS